MKTIDWKVTDTEKETIIECDHIWHKVDDGFATEVIVYDECELCGEIRLHERHEEDQGD